MRERDHRRGRSLTPPPAPALRLRGRILPSGETRDVYVADGRITFSSVPGAKTVTETGWILPGLVDVHAHLAISSPAPRARAHERVRASARAHLEAGVLLIREPGSPDRSSAGVGPAEGLPRVLTAGQFLAPPGGYISGLAREVTDEELPAAAEEEARASGAWAKVIGDFVGPSRRIVPNWDRDTLRKAASAVHRAGARIAIHATHPQAIADAIDARFDSVEHGTGVRPADVEAMTDRGTAFVPTLSISDLAVPFFEQFLDRPGLDELRGWLRTHGPAVAKAAAQGVAVLAGTDAGMTPHGAIAEEVARLLAVGVPAEAAIGAASWRARAYLGFPGIEEGAPADLLVLDADPRADPRALRYPALMVLDGRVVKTSHTAGSHESR